MRKKILIFIATALALLITILITIYIPNVIKSPIHELVNLKLNVSQQLLVKVISAIALTSIWLTVLYRSDNPQSKIGWLLILLINPLFGTLLFLTFGREFKKTFKFNARTKMHNFNYLVNEKEQESPKQLNEKSREIKDFIYKISRHPIYSEGTNVKVLTNGDQKFPCLIEELKKAEKFIFMEYYILKTDKIGKKVLDILKEKALQGVEVKLLYDYFGGTKAKRSYIRKLKKAGVIVKQIDRVYFPLFTTRLNHRLHRKVTIIDANVGFIGGLNLGDEYNHQSKKFGFWRDTHLLVKGHGVKSLTSIFIKDWYYETKDFIDNKKYFDTTSVESNCSIQTIQSGPDSKIPIIKEAYIKMINSAKKSIKIMTPYLILDPQFLSTLKTASYSGVDVKIITIGKADKQVVRQTSQSFFEPLLESGVEMYMYKKTFTHGKILIIDDEIASCGTFNLDIRSFELNFEATSILTGEPVKRLVDDYEDDLTHCKQVEYSKWIKRPRIKKVIEGILNIFSPIM